MLLLLALLGCVPQTNTPKDTGPEDLDRDDDGYEKDVDCDDRDPAVHPDATERCDELDVDEDCDGLADQYDEGALGAITVYQDADSDGYGADESATTACEVGTGQTVIRGDCDDADVAVNPDAVEECDGADKDEDCNSLSDDDDPGVVGASNVVYFDRDLDGYGDPEGETTKCDAPVGYVTNDRDCDDTADFVYPGASEVCDDVDNDCDGLADESDALDAGTWFADIDGDGFGDADATRIACAQPSGFVLDDTDCDDLDRGVYPGAREVCDGEDDDCDGTDDNSAVDASTWYRDSDNDGYGDDATTSTSCSAPSGYVSNDDDCNDASASISPADAEVCDSADVDEDCDGYADDDDNDTSSTGKTTWYADSDSDTYGDPASYRGFCDTPASGYVSNDDDCDDTSASIRPGGSEVCDSANNDEDCDGLADDNDTSVSSSGKSTFYRDADGDTYGTTTSTVSQCDAPTGYASTSTDCDDTTSARSPGNTEVCDASNVDEDCDSLADDADTSTSSTGKTTYYLDTDSDGYGATTGSVSRCDQPSGYITTGSDCNDTDADISPADPEVCLDTVDDDCSGSTICTWIATTDVDRTITGGTASDNAGYSIANAGDFNNDGYDDILIGAPYQDSGGTLAGMAYVVTSRTGSVTLTGSAATAFTGEDANDYAGYSVAGVGDTNGDGYDDVLIGAYSADDGAASSGTSYLVRGGSSSIDLSAATRRLYSTTSSEFSGSTVSAAGDVSGDGLADYLIGSSSSSTSRGQAWLILGSTSAGTSGSLTTYAGAILQGEASYDYAFRTMGAAGDVNGDGYDDMIFGADGNDGAASSAGAAYIVYGPQTGTASLSTADVRRRGPSSLDYAGRQVAGGCDVNGDGYADSLVGMYGYSYGYVYLIYGRATLSGSATLSSSDGAVFTATTYYVGYDEVACDGDINGDGYDEVALGDSYYSSNRGRVFVFQGGSLSGSYTTTTASATITNSSGSSSDYFGVSLAFIGAADGASGESDLVVSAYGAGTSDVGITYVYNEW